MHGWAYAVVHNLLRKSNAERRSFVLCHWSFAAANEQAGERGTRGEGTAKTADGGRWPRIGIRASRLAARGSWLALWLVACRSSLSVRFTAENAEDAESNSMPKTRPSTIFAACPAASAVRSVREGSYLTPSTAQHNLESLRPGRPGRPSTRG